MSASAHRRSCDELGACQSRATPCTGCAYPYAPGTIEHHSSHQRRALLRWLVRVAAFMAFVSASAFVAGLVSGALQ